MGRTVSFVLNGERTEVQVSPDQTLLELLREQLDLTGTKEACGQGECGACTVLVDGKAVNSCLMLAVRVDGKNVETIEGLAREDKLHPLQEAFVARGAIQCGFCTPGMVMTAKALLDEIPRPSEHEIRRYMAGNLCRCTGYVKIVDAIKAAAEKSVENVEARRC